MYRPLEKNLPEKVLRVLEEEQCKYERRPCSVHNLEQQKN